MKKLLIGVMAFFIITGVVAGIYGFRNEKANRESNVSFGEEDLYPENLRPIHVNEEESEKPLETQKSENKEELLPDENFVEFETEDEEQEEPNPEEISEEIKSEEEPIPENNVVNPEEIKPEEAATENIPAETVVAAGTVIEISNYRVRLRAFPSEDSPVLAICKEGETGTLTEYGESWSVIKINGREGYIHNSLWKAK